MSSQDAFFTTGKPDWFEPTDHCRGPWNTDACHAGPPTGLLARAAESIVPEKRLVRLCVDLIRPIPMSGFSVVADITRAGKTVSTSHAQLLNSDGKPVAKANALHIAPQPPHNFPTQSAHFGSARNALEGPFPISATHSEPAFPNAVQVRYPDGQDGHPGPSTVWMKALPLLANETPSPFQRICPLADCGNAFGRNAEPSEVSFINPDLTIVLHRDPSGDWLGSQSSGYWESNGLGMADAKLFDEDGVVGRAVQTLLLQAMS